MKKIVLLSSILFTSYFSMAQIDFGLKGAVTMSSLTTNLEDIEEAAEAGWQLGAFIRLGDTWHLQPEVYFGAKPGELTYAADPDNPMAVGNVTQNITLNTVDIPVLLGYKIIDPPTLNIRLQAGPVASFVTNKNIAITSDGTAEPEVPEGYEDNFNEVNWGLQMGAGVDFLFLTADIRYELGLNDVFEGRFSGAENGSYKNNVFILSVGFKIL